MLLALIVTAKSIATPLPTPPVSADACASLIPPKLLEVLGRENPGFEVPRSTDAPAERLQRIQDSGDWPCAFVAIGDFDGNGLLDRAVLLKSSGSPAVRVVAALNVDGAWQITLSQDWAIPIASAYLKPLEAGLYQRSKATETPTAELDKVPAIESDRSGFEAGQEKGRAAVYFFQEASWRHVWIAE